MMLSGDVPFVNKTSEAFHLAVIEFKSYILLYDNMSRFLYFQHVFFKQSFETDDKGRGVRTCEFIPADSYVVSYRGESLVSTAAIRERERKYANMLEYPGSFMFHFRHSDRPVWYNYIECVRYILSKCITVLSAVCALKQH